MTPARYCPKCGAKTVLVPSGEVEKINVKRIVGIRCKDFSWFESGHYAQHWMSVPFSTEVLLCDPSDLEWWTQGEGSK